jgi:hypothetical protein
MRMRIITTISDLRNLVDTWSGSEGLATDTATHDENVKAVARAIADERPDDLAWGDDWAEYLASIKPVWEYLD